MARATRAETEREVRVATFSEPGSGVASGKTMRGTSPSAAGAEALSRRMLTAGAGPIRELRAFDLRQSMKNGGGPACLRLRVVMSEAERAAVAANIWLDNALHATLTAWVERHYRDRLMPGDLADPALLDEGRRALDELSRLLRIGNVYPFQMG